MALAIERAEYVVSSGDWWSGTAARFRGKKGNRAAFLHCSTATPSGHLPQAFQAKRSTLRNISLHIFASTAGLHWNPDHTEKHWAIHLVVVFHRQHDCQSLVRLSATCWTQTELAEVVVAGMSSIGRTRVHCVDRYLGYFCFLCIQFTYVLHLAWSNPDKYFGCCSQLTFVCRLLYLSKCLYFDCNIATLMLTVKM